MNPAGAFAKVAQASATGGGNNIRDGIYKLMVEKAHYQHGHTGECFIAEFRVLESAPSGALDERGNQVTPNAVGSSCSIVCNITKHESAAGNFKAFVVAALGGLGVPEASITPEFLGQVCSDQNPLRGVIVTDETYRTINKGRSNAANAGKPLTLNKFKPIAQTEEQVAQQRAWLDVTAVKADAAPQAPAASTSTLGQIAAPQQVAAPAPQQVAAPAPQQVAAPAPTPTPAAKPGIGGLLGGFLGAKQ